MLDPYLPHGLTQKAHLTSILRPTWLPPGSWKPKANPSKDLKHQRELGHNGVNVSGNCKSAFMDGDQATDASLWR
jgi:hypothetical protein